MKVIGTRKGLLEEIASQLREEFSGPKVWAKIKIFRKQLSGDLWGSITGNLSELHSYSDITRYHGICDYSDAPIKIGSLDFYKDAESRHYLCGFKVCLSKCGDFLYWSVPNWGTDDVFEQLVIT